MTSDERSMQAEAAYRDEVGRNLPRNYVAHLAHGMLGQTGFRLILAPTFIPNYLFLLTGSDFAVGLARGLQFLGMAVSPIWSASLIEHRRRVLPTGFVVGAAMRLQVLGLALAGLLLVGDWRFPAICLFLGLFGFFMGMQGVIFNFLMSKVIPVEKRGVLQGLRNMLAGATSIGVAAVAGSVLVEREALGDGYAATFLLAFGLTSVGLCMLLFVREPEPPSVREPSNVLARIREVPALLRADPHFTRYFACRALGTMGRMAIPFYILYAGTRLEITGTALGNLTVAFLFAQTAGNLGWGWIADRTGFRLVFIASLVVWILAALLLVLSSGPTTLLAVFAGLGAGQGGFQMAGQNMVLEFGAREDLPMRIAVVNTGSELVGAVGPILGGIIAMGWGYPAVVWLATGCQVIAVLGMWLFVKEPRPSELRRW